MTHDQVKFNADIMIQVIRETLKNSGNARLAYAGCEPEVQALIKCQLSHREKRALGIVAENEPDPLEMALRTRTRERQEALFGQPFDAHARLQTRMAELYYDILKVA